MSRHCLSVALIPDIHSPDARAAVQQCTKQASCLPPPRLTILYAQRHPFCSWTLIIPDRTEPSLNAPWAHAGAIPGPHVDAERMPSRQLAAI